MADPSAPPPAPALPFVLLPLLLGFFVFGDSSNRTLIFVCGDSSNRKPWILFSVIRRIEKALWSPWGGLWSPWGVLGGVLGGSWGACGDPWSAKGGKSDQKPIGVVVSSIPQGPEGSSKGSRGYPCEARQELLGVTRGGLGGHLGKRGGPGCHSGEQAALQNHWF